VNVGIVIFERFLIFQEITPLKICWKFAVKQELISVSQRSDKNTKQHLNYSKSNS